MKKYLSRNTGPCLAWVLCLSVHVVTLFYRPLNGLDIRWAVIPVSFISASMFGYLWYLDCKEEN